MAPSARSLRLFRTAISLALSTIQKGTASSLIPRDNERRCYSPFPSRLRHSNLAQTIPPAPQAIAGTPALVRNNGVSVVARCLLGES